MQKKISAAFILSLFIISTLATPVQAHFTLGINKATYDYHDTDFDAAQGAHIAGLTGYVFPGAGPTSAPAPGFLTTGGGQGGVGNPGYQSLYPGGNPPGSPSGWQQADANSYGPFGAILTSTIKSGTAFNKLFLNGNPTIWGPLDNPLNALAIEHTVEGDLVFAINYTLPATGFPTPADGYQGYAFNRFDIYLPPEFQGIKRENVVASFTNAYGNIPPMSVTDVEAEIVPNQWTRVRVNTDTQEAGLTTGRVVWFGNQTYGDVWVYIRVNKVTAPTVAGKYFFKMAACRAVPDGKGGYGSGEYYWLGAPTPPWWNFQTNGVPNFPVLLVKGEVDPAYVDGTVRYGGYSGASYYGMPLSLAGRVRLVGRAIDPFTLQTTNRPVEARGYFNQSAGGHFEVEGVAPGVYDIFASAAGYPEKLIQSAVTILKGQSYHVDAYLTPGIVIQGEVFSKCGTGEVNWVTWQDNPFDGNKTQDIKIEIYKIGSVAQSTGTCSVTQENVENVNCGGSTNAVSWSPVPYMFKLRNVDVAKISSLGPPTNDYAVGQSNARNNPANSYAAGWGNPSIAFPWAGYGGNHGIGFDSMGVGPHQQWQVQNTKANFKFQFGDKGLYGVPAMFDGHVPQLNATWVDGLPAGQYELRAFTYGYVQTKADGATFEHITINVPAVEWPGDIYVPFDMRLSNYVKKTVHFHDVAGTLSEKHIPGTQGKYADYRFLYLATIKDDDTVQPVWGWKVDQVYTCPTLPTQAGGGNVIQNELDKYGLDANGMTTSFTMYSRGLRAQGPAFWNTGGGRNYGFEAGLYTLKAYMFGYVEQVFEKVTIGLCGSEVAISDHLYRGAMFNVTFFSKDWQHPTADKTWMYPDEYIYLQIWSTGKQLSGYGLMPAGTTNPLRGNEYWSPDGKPSAGATADVTAVNSWFSDGTTQPFVPSGLKVTTTLRIKQGHLTKNWPTNNSTWAWLYYEGQEAHYFNDADWGYYPTSFESGMYSFVGLTYGYVMQMDPVTRTAKPFQVYAQKGGVANIPLKLVQGVQIPLIIRFKHERVFEGLRYNSTVRVRVLDDKDNLVGEWLTSGSINGTSSALSPGPELASPPQYSGVVIPDSPPGKNLNKVVKALPADKLVPPLSPWSSQIKNFLGPGYGYAYTKGGVKFFEALNYVPRGVTMLNLTICGLPDPYTTGCGAQNNGLLGYDRIWDTSTFTGTGPKWVGAPGGPYGISGDPWYTGGYYVEVEVVPFGQNVPNNHYTMVTSPKAALPSVVWPLSVYDGWYTHSGSVLGPVAGLLYGESCTIDPRTGKLYTWAIPPNHLGPYQQRVQVQLPGAHLGGDSSGILELDHLGLVSGVAYTYTWCDDWRTTSWIQVMFSGAPGILNYYTFDGRYQAYVPAGTWKMDVIPWAAGAKAPGYASQSLTVNVSEGAFSNLNVYLEESGVPVPEFPTAIVVLASALAAALSILRRRKTK